MAGCAAADPRQAPRAQGRMPSRLRRRRRIRRRPSWSHCCRPIMSTGSASRGIANVARRVAPDFPGRAYLAAQHLYRGDDARRLAPPGAHRRRRPACKLVATNDVLYHAPERRPLQDVVTCIREHCTDRRGRVPPRRQCRAPSEAGRRDGAAVPRPWIRTALAAHVEIAERCRFSLDELRYEYPEVPARPA